MKIGVGYTVHNRNNVASHSVSMSKAYSAGSGSKHFTVVVDDASIEPIGFADFRFENNVGIATAKNKCIELLYDAGCTHFFLFDDDLHPIVSDWWEPYINSGLEHACWNYNRRFIWSNMQYAEYDKPNGCMMYATRKVIDTVGGIDTDFKGYGYDHPNWSDRIFNSGLTPARYIDIPGSSHLFKMADCDTSVSYSIRASTIPINERLYKEKFYSKEFKPFK